MPSDELRKAADHLRTNPSDYSDWQREKDKIVVVRGYLAEHPADDAEPITKEWLRGMGFEQCDTDRLILRDPKVIPREVSMLEWFSNLKDSPPHCIGLRFSGSWLRKIKTRGQLRRLLLALEGRAC